tara:strand:+ start:365 stop:994 length:630 start_codon:yes stop_codon:yes gene_type:complete
MATNMKLNFVLFTLSFIFNAAIADSLIDGSIEKGKAISITCGACHGADGNSINPLWPNLANQHASYSVQQLTAFRDGKRMDSLMSAMAMALSDQDIKDLSVYFESLPSSLKDIADPATFDLGQKLYRGGNKESGVAACMACHGPAGKGNPAALYPALNGQGAMYTVKQLNDYASGTRVSISPVQIMQDVAKKLTQEEIQAVSSYIQGLH